MKIAGIEFQLAENGRKGRSTEYALYSDGSNFVLVDRMGAYEYPGSLEDRMGKLLNVTVPWENYEKMGDILNEKQGVAAYVYQIDPYTAADVVMVDLPEVHTAKAIRNAANQCDKSRKFVDATSSQEDFPEAVPGLGEKIQGLGR